MSLMSIKKYLGYNERKCRIIQNFLAGVVISHKIMNEKKKKNKIMNTFKIHYSDEFQRSKFDL